MSEDEKKAHSVIQNFERGLEQIKSKPGTKISILDEGSEKSLKIEYPRPTNDPSSRDVWLEAANQDWSKSDGITFTLQSDLPTIISVSFFDTNMVAYTAWVEVATTKKKEFHLLFENIKQNPYFQLSGAETGAPMELSKMTRIGVSPQTVSSGTLILGPVYTFKSEAKPK